MTAVPLSGWGNFPRLPCEFAEPRSEAEVARLLAAAPHAIARGNGRSYGDAALNPAQVIGARRLDRMIAFDAERGVLTCESGVLLADVVDVFLPRGWFPFVTPGTKFVTIGGALASDVHGKNHHREGSFGDHVERIRLLRADGAVTECSPMENTALFAATRGGMGLTGVILEVAFRLRRVESAHIRQRVVRAADLDATMAGLEDGSGSLYSVAWIDCLARGGRMGRALVFLGEHAEADALPAALRAAPLHVAPRGTKTMPVTLPGFALNRWSVSAFNEVYYRFAGGSGGEQIIDYDRYFYPLDAILGWNRMYGRAGFVQHQCVLPKAESRAGLAALLGRISESGLGSFLAVLKLLGPGPGMMSFPMEGYTLALDFPASTRALSLLVELDAIVERHGGRIYLAKDARTSPALLRRGYPDLDRFRALRAETGAAQKFRSLMSERLCL